VIVINFIIIFRDEAAHIVRSAMDSHPNVNFDYIFCELLLPTKRDGLMTIAAIRKCGFEGKIIGMTVSYLFVYLFKFKFSKRFDSLCRYLTLVYHYFL